MKNTYIIPIPARFGNAIPDVVQWLLGYATGAINVTISDDCQSAIVTTYAAGTFTPPPAGTP
jgi:hypothetical protein